MRSQQGNSQVNIWANSYTYLYIDRFN